MTMTQFFNAFVLLDTCDVVVRPIIEIDLPFNGVDDGFYSSVEERNEIEGDLAAYWESEGFIPSY